MAAEGILSEEEINLVEVKKVPGTDINFIDAWEVTMLEKLLGVTEAIAKVNESNKCIIKRFKTRDKIRGIRLYH